MRRGLGRGLSQLLGESAAEMAPSSLPLTVIHANSRQPRRSFDEEALRELSDSIRQYGVIQPLIVRPIADGEYELIAGERRLRASLMAGLTEVPVVIRSASAQASLEIAIIENVQREDITAMDCALAYRRLIDEFSLSQEEVAAKVGKSRAAIANTLRLLKLPEEIQEAIQDGELTEGHARAILMAEGQARQMQIFAKARGGSISVREAERLARLDSSPRLPAAAETPAAAEPGDPNWDALGPALAEFLGTTVRLRRAGKGGKLEIDFYSDEDLTRLLDSIGFQMD